MSTEVTMKDLKDLTAVMERLQRASSDILMAIDKHFTDDSPKPAPFGALEFARLLLMDGLQPDPAEIEKVQKLVQKFYVDIIRPMMLEEGAIPK
jgi:hypothetical protein